MNKKLKLNDQLDLPDDMLILQDKLCSELDMFLDYDFVMNQFGIGITKQTKDKSTCIRLNEIECAGVLRLTPYALRVAANYSSSRASKPVDIPFETKELNAGDMGTVLFIKENNFKRGDIQFDLRKCVKKEDDSLIYTKEGVRLNMEMMRLVQEKLASYKQKIKETVKITRNLMLTAQACLMIEEIKSLSYCAEKPSCYGCEIDHPSQVQHMSLGGCLSDETMDVSETWAETVNQQWSVVFATVSVEDARDLAEKALPLLPELQGLVYSSSEKMIDPLEDELKDMVTKREELSNDQMYIACQKVMKN